MWNKEKKIEESRIAETTSFFAKGFRLVGDVDANDDVRVDGTVQGNIKTSEKVIIGMTGSIVGNINATNIHLMGEISGDIFISGLARIGETAKINGTITANSLQIEPGAIIEAAIKRFSSTANESIKDHTVMKEINKIETKPENLQRLKF